MTVLLGYGDGTFKPTAMSPVTGSIPYSVAVADFNGGGKPNLVTANAGSNTLTVPVGNGDGTSLIRPKLTQDVEFAKTGGSLVQ